MYLYTECLRLNRLNKFIQYSMAATRILDICLLTLCFENSSYYLVSFCTCQLILAQSMSISFEDNPFECQNPTARNFIRTF